MTDFGPDVTVRIGVDLDRRRVMRGNQCFAVLRNHARDRGDSVNRAGLVDRVGWVEVTARAGCMGLSVTARYHGGGPAAVAINCVGKREFEVRRTRGRGEMWISIRTWGRANSNANNGALDSSGTVAIERPNSNHRIR